MTTLPAPTAVTAARQRCQMTQPRGAISCQQTASIARVRTVPAHRRPNRPRWRNPPRRGSRSAQARPAGAGGRVADRRARPGRRATRAPSPGQYLTTAQGLRLARHRPLAEGRPARPDPAAGPPPAREDHALRPRAHPRAGRPRPRRRRARRLPVLRHGRRRSPGPASWPRTSRPRCSSASPPCWAPGARPTPSGTPAGFATKFYTDEGTFDLVGNNIPVFFIQDGIKFPDVIHAGQAAPGPRDPAGPERPRHLLGLRLAAHRGPGPHHVEHVRPRHPALLPHDGRLRRPHLPARQRRGRHHAGEVPLEAEAGRPLPGLGGGPDHQRHGPRLPPPGPGRRHRGRRLPASGNSACRSSRTPRTRCSRGSTCSTPPSSCPRSWRRCSRSAS